MSKSAPDAQKKSTRARGRAKRDYQLVSYLAGLTGSEVAESILVLLSRENECYSSKMSRYTGYPHQAIGSQLRRLEGAGIVLRRMIGRTVCYTFNRQSPWVAHLIASVHTYFDQLPTSEQLAFFEPKKLGSVQRSHSRRLMRMGDSES